MDLEKYLLECKTSYYKTGKSNINDLEFDKLEQILKTHENIELPVGLPEGGKKKLPLWLGSLSKRKDILNFNCDSGFILQPKFDGESCLIYNYKIYTRGNGEFGSDITHKFNIKKNYIFDNFAVRGEIIITKTNFNKFFSDKYKNPRNCVCGIINRKNNSDNIKYVDIVIYEILKKNPLEIQLTPTEQNYLIQTFHNFLNKNEDNMFIKPSIFQKVDKLSIKNLEDNISYLKNCYEYDIDGLVIYKDKNYIRKHGENPKNIIAYKSDINKDIKISKVLKVNWQCSKQNKLIPVIEIEPIELNNTIVKRVCCFNANYIEKNNIGVNTIIEVYKSGEIIPFLNKIIKPTKFEVPKNAIWDENHVHLYKKNNDKDSDIKKLIHFFKKMDIKLCGTKTAEKFYNNGFKTPSDILRLKSSKEINTFLGEKNSESIINNIKNSIKTKDLHIILSSIEFFGPNISNKKIYNLLCEHSLKDLLYKTYVSNTNISEKLLKCIIDNNSVSLIYYNLHYKLFNEKQLEFLNGKKLKNKQILICTSGFRDYTKILNYENYNFTSNINKNVNFLILKEPTKQKTSKEIYAEKHNIKIITLYHFNNL